MRTLAIGDIHGCATAFDLLLSIINLKPVDTVVTLGDYVDRGSNSKGVIDRLIEVQQRGHLIALRGNHEQMMIHARHDVSMESHWRESGGNATLASYGDPGTMADVPAEHWDFIENQCLDYWENETHFFVHANVYSDLPLFDQPDYMLFWEKFNNPAPHISGKVMICGHTSQKSGLPINIGHAICVDTWAYGRGWLSCLDVKTGQLWQANQAGQQRQLWMN